MSGVSVAVIGAGLAGLRTASELSRAGYEVTVLEGLSVVGGSAAGSFRDGFSLDGTIPLVRSSDRALISWIEQSELSASLLPPRACIDSQIHRGEIGPIDTSTLSDLAKIPGVTTWDKKRLLRLPRLMARYRAQLDPDRPELAADLDYRSARDFATLYLGKSVWDYWVSPETTSQYASDEMELSRVAFLLSRMTSREGKVALGVMRQGLWQLAERAASRLNVVHDLWADEVTERGDGGYQVHCSFATGDGETHVQKRLRAIDVDAVVVATSPEAAGQIAAPVLVPAERDYFARYRGGPSMSLVLALSAPLAHYAKFVRVPKVEASTIECYLSECGAADGRAPDGKGLVMIRANERFASANSSAADDVVEKSLLASFSRFHPEVRDRVLFTRLRRTQTGNPNFHVGAYRELARLARVQEDRGAAGRRIYFAGDYLIGPGPNQVVSSGMRAAAALRAHFEG